MSILKRLYYLWPYCCLWEVVSGEWTVVMVRAFVGPRLVPAQGALGCVLAQLEGQMRPVFRAGWCKVCKVCAFYKAPYINLITVGFSIFPFCLSRDAHSFSQKDAFYGAAARWRAASVCSADFNCLSVAVKVSVKYTTVKRAAGPKPGASWETEMNLKKQKKTRLEVMPGSVGESPSCWNKWRWKWLDRKATVSIKMMSVLQYYHALLILLS